MAAMDMMLSFRREDCREGWMFVGEWRRQKYFVKGKGETIMTSGTKGGWSEE
jgi:hypothetical protein